MSNACADSDKSTASSKQKTAADPDDELPSMLTALSEKARGNEYFKAGQYASALRHYTSAIELCGTEQKSDLAVCHQNRAAAHEMMGSFDQCKTDCDSALRLNARYSKALLRRARALERLGQLSAALQDVTAVCILDGFQNQTALALADKVLRQLGEKLADERCENLGNVLPSNQNIVSFLKSFVEDPLVSEIFTPSSSDSPTHNGHSELNGLQKAMQAVRDGRMKTVVSNCTDYILQQETTEAPVQNGASTGSLRGVAPALLLRATFYMLAGQMEEAVVDLNRVISDTHASSKLKINALIKRATCSINDDFSDQEKMGKFNGDFDEALRLDDKNCDIYFHRGQVKLTMGVVDEARSDFEQVLSLCSSAPLAAAQLAHIKFSESAAKQSYSGMTVAERKFQSLIEKHPSCVEVRVLFAQALVELQRFEDADRQFEAALAADPKLASTYVSRGHLLLQWKGDMDKAAELMNAAIELDNDCDMAYESLGMIEVQRGDLERGVALFDSAVALAGKRADLTRLFCLREAARVQLLVSRDLGISIKDIQRKQAGVM